MKTIKITSNRVAAYISSVLSKDIRKGYTVKCDVIVDIIYSKSVDRETKKAFLGELVDNYNEEDFIKIFSKIQDREAKIKLKKLFEELKEELLSGEWERKEIEYDMFLDKIRRRNEIIDNL